MMHQVKLYQFDENASMEALRAFFPNNALYFFSNLPNAVGVGFDFDDNNLKNITIKASYLNLNPIILTGKKFFKLIDTLFTSGKRIVEIKFTVDIDEEAQELLDTLLSGNITELKVFIKDYLKSNEIFIKNISWHEGAKPPVKLSLFDNGILYVNDGIESLKQNDKILSNAILC